MKFVTFVLATFTVMTVFGKSLEHPKVTEVYSKFNSLGDIWFPIESELLHCRDVDIPSVIFTVKKDNKIIYYDVVKLNDYSGFIDHWWLTLSASESFPDKELDGMNKLLGILSPIELTSKIDETDEYFYYISKDKNKTVLIQKFDGNILLATEKNDVDWTSFTDDCRFLSSEQTREEFRNFLELD